MIAPNAEIPTVVNDKSEPVSVPEPVIDPTPVMFQLPDMASPVPVILPSVAIPP